MRAQSDTNAPAMPGRITWRTLLLASAAALGMVLASLDFAVNVGLPAMRDAFNTDLASVQWVIVVFIATRAGLALGAGAFADRFGLRLVYLFGTTTYVVSMVCLSLSPTLEVLVGFRVLQALGTGCLYSTAPAIAASVFPEHRRGLSMGFTSASLALGMVTSTLGAGPLIQLFDWPAVFAGRLPLAGLALLIGLFSIPRSLGNQPTDDAEKPRFDLPGSALVLSLLLCLMIGLRLGQAIGWTSIPVLALLAASPPILVALIRVERSAASPVLPGALVRLSGFQTAVGAMFLGHFSQFVIWFIFPFYITDALGRGPVTLGIMLAVMSTSNILSSPIGGWLCDRWGVRPVGAAGLLTSAFGLFAMSMLDGNSAVWHPAVGIAVVGLGVGWYQSAAYALMLGTVPAERYGTASGAMSLAQASGTVLCVAIVGAVFSALSDLYAASIPADAAFLLAYRDVFRIGAITAAVAAITFALRARQPRITSRSP
ncbi:MAG: MFS transporter [Chloroflexota bacterium]|nr:MFS transporter [Chloroflexota bacterium]MDE2958959.1 MFS transporter [Chloroflexota bacterium]